MVSDNELWELRTDKFYVTFKAVDSRGIPISDVTISVISEFTGETLGFDHTSPQGFVTLRIPKNRIKVKGEWSGISVYDDILNIDGDKGRNDPIILDCSVFYVDVEVLDEKDVVVKDAVVTVLFMGHIIESVTTDDEGTEELRLPAGSYNMYISWNGVRVLHQQVDVTDDDSWSLNVNIFYLNVQVLDADDVPVLDATVSAINIEYPSIGSSEKTDINGSLTFRLPMGSYEIAVRWKDRLTGKLEEYELDSSKDLIIDAEIFYLSIDVVDDRGIPLENAFITVSHLEMDEVFDAKISDDSSSIRVRMPAGAYQVEVTWKQKLVHREDNIVMDGNRKIVLNADVYYITLVALSEDGDPIKDVEVQISDDEGIIGSGALTDGNGTAEFRLPADDYTVELFLKKTVNFKRIEMNRTEFVSVGPSQTVEVKFSGYPPSFFTTPLFYASLLPIFLLILFFAIAAYLFLKRPWENAEADSEEAKDEGSPDEKGDKSEGKDDTASDNETSDETKGASPELKL
ncbi:MAG: hypothetical protein R6V01_09085 [Thermoplasmatota archaeon]